MGNLQKEALIAYEKIKAERGEVTFIDAFVAGCDYMRDKTENWTDKDEEMLSEVLRSVDAVESEWGCDLQDEIDWLNEIKERLQIR